MLELDELRLKAIGRFVEEQVIEFDKLGNLVQIDGVRLDTGGSSGAGKSTVFNSLDYLFGLNDSLPSTVLQSRFTKEAISVTFKGKYNDQPLTITRGKGKLIVDINGTVTTGSKLAEEKIDEILGMPRKLFRPLLHKRQKEGGFFLQFTPGQIHEFLTDALGHSAIRLKAELVEKKLKSLNDEITLTQSLLNQNKSALEATDNAINALGTAPIKDMDQQTILSLKAQHDLAMEALPPLKTRHTLETQALDLTKPELRSTTMDDSAEKAAEAQLATIEAEQRVVDADYAKAIQEERDRALRYASAINGFKVQLSTLRYDVQRGDEVKKQAQDAALEVKKIRESMCPTCAQGWATDAAKAREAVLLEKIKNYKELILKGATSAQEIITITAQIEQHTPLAVEQRPPIPANYEQFGVRQRVQRDILSAERARRNDYASAQHHINKVAMDNWAVGLRTLNDKQAAELQQVNGQIDITRRALESAAQKLRSYEEARVRHENSSKTLSEQKQKHQKAVISHETTLETLKNYLILAEELKKAIKGYTSCSFDEALEYIGAAATEIIRAIPNMANATIQLEGIRETADGKVKEEVNAVLSMDGETGIPIKSLSGGERSSVDLAVDLAVVDLLENRTNKGINIFILDEPFTGLDTVSIEMAIEKLKSLNKRLIIVDHNPEIKQMVESRLTVYRDGLTSKIVQN